MYILHLNMTIICPINIGQYSLRLGCSNDVLGTSRPALWQQFYCEGNTRFDVDESVTLCRCTVVL